MLLEIIVLNSVRYAANECCTPESTSFGVCRGFMLTTYCTSPLWKALIMWCKRETQFHCWCNLEEVYEFSYYGLHVHEANTSLGIVDVQDVLHHGNLMRPCYLSEYSFMGDGNLTLHLRLSLGNASDQLWKCEGGRSYFEEKKKLWHAAFTLSSVTNFRFQWVIE